MSLFFFLHPIPGSSHAHKRTTAHNTCMILMSISAGIDLSYQASNRRGWKVISSSFASFSVTPHHSTSLFPFAFSLSLPFILICFRWTSTFLTLLKITHPAGVKWLEFTHMETLRSLYFLLLVLCFQPKHPLPLAVYTETLGEWNI